MSGITLFDGALITISEGHGCVGTWAFGWSAIWWPARGATAGGRWRADPAAQIAEDLVARGGRTAVGPHRQGCGALDGPRRRRGPVRQSRRSGAGHRASPAVAAGAKRGEQAGKTVGLPCGRLFRRRRTSPLRTWTGSPSPLSPASAAITADALDQTVIRSRPMRVDRPEDRARGNSR